MQTFKEFLDLSEAYNYLPKSSDQIRDNKLIKNRQHLADLFDDIINISSDIPDPIAVDLKKPNSVKIHRGLDGVVDLAELSKKYKLNLTFGNGSRGNMGAGNTGNLFEKYLADDIRLFIETRSLDNKFRYPNFMKNFSKEYLDRARFMEVKEEGELNQKRPLKISGKNVYIGGPLQNIGSTVTDVTINIDGKPLYLSLKLGSKVSLFNSGLGSFFAKKDFENGIISNRDGQVILDLFGIDNRRFVSVFNDYDKSKVVSKAPKSIVNVTNTVNKNILNEFLASALGFGYLFVHTPKISNDSVYFDYIEKSTVMKDMKPNSVIIEYPKDGTAKRVDVKIDTPAFDLNVNFRNKRGGVIPSHLLMDYKVK